jgi:hypothetical protein
MSQSICSLTPNQQSSSPTKLELKEKPKTFENRIVNSDLHLSLSGQTSMLMLTRKHEFAQQAETSKLARSMQSINEDKKNIKKVNKKAASVEFHIEEDEEESNFLSKYAQGVPFQHVSDVEDRALVLEFFDPVRNDKRRAEIECQSRLLQQDVIGFRAIQQQLKNFDALRILRIGRRKTRIPLKNIQNLDKLYSQLILRHYHTMGRVSVFEVKPYLKYKIKSLLG